MASSQLDLHTGCPIWTAYEDEPPAGTGPLEANIRCQVAIVGGGVTGALLADQLTRHGFDAVLLDSRPFGSGSTLASTSLLLCEPDTHFCELADRLNLEAARRICLLGARAIDHLESLASQAPDGCGFARRPVLYLASRGNDVPLLEREHDVRCRMSLAVERWTADELRSRGYSFTAPLALRSALAAEINSYRLTQLLIRRSIDRGLRAFSPTAAIASDGAADGTLCLTTDSKHVIRADAVVFATGYEAHAQVREDLGMLSSTWAFASEPVESFAGWPDRALIWETARPYVYLRTTPDNRVLMGGGDEPFAEAHAEPRMICRKAGELAVRFGQMFPDIPMCIATAWAGVFGSSRDGLPYIGRPDTHVPVYYALGYGGNGITFSVIAAEVIVQELLGSPHPDAELFLFGR